MQSSTRFDLTTSASTSLEIDVSVSTSTAAFDYTLLQEKVLNSLPMGARAEFDARRERILSSTDHVKERLEGVMNSKLSPTSLYHYCHYDEGSDPEVQKAKMSHFITNELEGFTEKAMQIFSLLRKEDIYSLGTDRETEVAFAFKSLVKELEEAGFSDAKGKPRNFWSGDLARKIAYADEGFVSDSQVPTVSALFDMCWLIQESEVESKRNDLYCFLPSAISSLYAYGAEGPVHVFLSSNKSSEPPSLQAGNYFWDGELPILNQKRNEALAAGAPSPKIEFILAVDKRESPNYLNNDPANRIPLRRKSDDATNIAARPYNERVIPFEKLDRIPVMRRMAWSETHKESSPVSARTRSPSLCESPDEEKAYFKPRPMDKNEISELMKAGPRKTIRAGALQGCVKTFLVTLRDWRAARLEESDSSRPEMHGKVKRIASADDIKAVAASEAAFYEASRTLQRSASTFM